jgi:hypothetical protein
MIHYFHYTILLDQMLRHNKYIQVPATTPPVTIENGRWRQ